MFEGLDCCLNYKSDHILEKLELLGGGYVRSGIHDMHEEQNVNIVKKKKSVCDYSQAVILGIRYLLKVFSKEGSSKSLLNPVYIKSSNTM